MCGATQLAGTLFSARPHAVLTRSASYNSLSRSSSQYAVWAVVMETARGTFYESLIPGARKSGLIWFKTRQNREIVLHLKALIFSFSFIL